MTIVERMEARLRSTVSHWQARWFCSEHKRLYVTVAVIGFAMGVAWAAIQVFVLGG